jgi:two-component system, cell cycle sensor histidine kinase and response regulator CckA
MPHLTGLNLCREIKRIRRSIPVVLCTGNSEAFTASSLTDAGISELIRKPFSFSSLAKTIREVLES